MASTKKFGSGLHILIVEDDEMMQSLLMAYLVNEGYKVSGVGTGKAMISFLNHNTVDLCLLDLTLPDEDGLTLARQVRVRSDLPIIVMTARTSMDDRLAGLDIGADDRRFCKQTAQENRKRSQATGPHRHRARARLQICRAHRIDS